MSEMLLCAYQQNASQKSAKREAVRMNDVSRSWLSFLLTASFLIGAVGLHFVQLANAKTSAASLPAIGLTIVSSNGTTVFLDENNITASSTTSGCGGFINSLNNIRGWGNYTGVSLKTLCDLVGDLTSNNNVTIFGSDGYNATLTYDQVANGNFTTYDKTTKAQVPHNQPLVPIIAYFLNGTSFGSYPTGDGPLRLAIVGPEGLITKSAYWVKYATRIEIYDGSVPEFPPSAFLSLLIITTLVVVLTKIWRQQHGSSHPRSLTK